MQRLLSFLLLPALLLSAAGSQWGCGYSLQRSQQTPLFAREGIRRVYVAPVLNNTFKAGVENVVYNQVLRSLASYGRVSVVQNRAEADAVLNGSVEVAAYAASAKVPPSDLFPQGRYASVPRGSTNDLVAFEYAATLGCGFSLTRLRSEPGKREIIWSGSFSKSKIFPGNNQLGPFGTTSALINESEFDRAIRDLAEGMTLDLNESMLAGF